MSIIDFRKDGDACQLIVYRTATGRTTTSRCLPVSEKYLKTEYKKKVLQNTDDVEYLQFGTIALVLLDIILTIFKMFQQKLQTTQILANQGNVPNNTPTPQRRNSQYAIQNV